MSVLAAMIATTLIVSGSQPAPVEPNSPAPVWLHGQFQQGTSIMVPYPAGFIPGLEGNVPLGESLPIGVRNTETLQNTPGSKTLMGTSQGAMVLDQVMADDTRAGVPASKVSFVVIEDPQRGSGILSFFKGMFIPGMNYTPKKPTVTPYNVTEIVKQYEGAADFPNNPLSPGFLLAVVNAGVGGMLYHSNTVYTDLSTVPKSNMTTSVNSLGGKTTTFLVPTPILPLLQPLVGHVPMPIVNGLNGFLKPIIDSAYSRAQKDSKPTASVKPAKHGGHHK